MISRSFMIIFSAVVVPLFLFLVVDSTYAQRGGGARGGGGASGVSRGGAASSGSFSDTGARSASSAQSSAASRQQTSTVNQAQRQSAQSQNVQIHQQAATSRTDTRTEAYDESRHNQPGLWDNPGAVAATGYVAGRAVGAAAVPVVAAPPCSATVNTVDNVTYYSCGATSYTQSYAGGSVVYVETAPPPGY
jgi:hypothetical protein